MSAVSKVVTSQKNQVAVAGLAALVAGSEAGLRDVVMELIGGITALVVLVQGGLDWKWGSASDKTGKFTGS